MNTQHKRVASYCCYDDFLFCVAQLTLVDKLRTLLIRITDRLLCCEIKKNLCEIAEKFLIKIWRWVKKVFWMMCQTSMTENFPLKFQGMCTYLHFWFQVFTPFDFLISSVYWKICNVFLMCNWNLQEWKPFSSTPFFILYIRYASLQNLMNFKFFTKFSSFSV